MKKQIILLLFSLSIGLFFFNLLFLNDSVFTDGQLYITETQNLLQEKSLSPIQQLFPLKHYLMERLFQMIPLPIETFNKLFPLIVMMGCLVFAYLISKELFGKDYLPALLIGFGNYWVINFFALNYIEPLISLFLLTFFYFFLRYEKSKGNAFVNVLGIVLSITALIFTKIIGLVLAPVLFFFFVLLLIRKKKHLVWLTVIPFLVLVLRVLNKNNKSETVLHLLLNILNNLISFFTFSFYEYLIQFGRIVFALFYFPPNPLLNEMVFGVFLPVVKFVFLLIVFPLFLFGLYSLWKSLFEKDLFFRCVGLTCFVTFGLLLTYLFGMTAQIHARYVIVVLPLLGFVLFKFWREIKDKKIKRLLFWLFVVFTVYGLGYSLVSTLYHLI